MSADNQIAKMLNLNKKALNKIRQEVNAVFIVTCMFFGASTFIIIMAKVWLLEISYWWLLALSASIIGLPTAFKQLRKTKEPLIVRFARAFRFGFLSLRSLIPALSFWVMDNYKQKNPGLSNESDLK